MKQVAIVNDILGGCLGEKRVFWNYMLDYFGDKGMFGVSWNTFGCSTDFESNVKKYIGLRGCDTIIQNATFMGTMDESRHTICFLQDNFRGMGIVNEQQEHNLRNADVVVVNSKTTAASYPEYNSVVIPIGIDSDLFSPKDKTALRNKYGIPLDTSVGIFVGAFNEVKGWSKIKHVVESRPDVFFILVSKHRDDRYYSENSSVFNVVNQELLSDLYGMSDFFILGSPVETQCLAALEASFSGLPVIMNSTGIYMDWEDRNAFGCFGVDFSVAIDWVLKHEYDTRTAIMSKGLSIDDMLIKWETLLESI